MSKYFEIKFLVVFSLLSALFLQADAQNGMIDSLRLVNSETGNVITSISMNTDSSLSIKMQVVWSDDAAKTWVDGTGTWKLSPDTIKWDANPPSEGSSWNINPKTPGNENLTVTSGSVSKVITVTITPESPFHLFPGPTFSFKLEYSNGNPIQGPDTLYYPNGAVNIFTRAYDQYGNLIGNIRSTWTKTGTLPSFTPPTTNQANVYIDASNAVFNEAGWVKASAPSGVVSGDTVSDSVQIIIIARKANLIRSVHKNIMEKFSIKVYKNQITFMIRPDLVNNSKIKIQNLSGKLIADFQGSQNTIWNCKGFSAGLYIARIYLNNDFAASIPVVLNP
jgi:hypothetical protein